MAGRSLMQETKDRTKWRAIGDDDDDADNN